MAMPINKIEIKPTMFTKENLRLFGLILLTIVSIIIIKLATKDSKAYYDNTLVYILVILLFIFSIFTYFINGFDSKSKGFIYIFIFIVLIIVISITVSFKIGLVDLLTNNYVTNTLLVIILLFALAIIYYMFLEKMVTRPGWLSFFIKFLFYLPCVFTDGIKYIIQEGQSTSKIVLYLLFFEFLLICVYIYLSTKLQSSVYDNGIILLEQPTILNTEQRIDKDFYRTFINKKPEPGSKVVTINSPIRQSYSLSMWIYLNIQPFSQLSYEKESTIFAYLDSFGNGHPKITYKNNKQGIDKYIFYLSQTTTYSRSLPHQKWNNIVLNYRDLAVDIFINGVLDVSIPLNETPIYTNRDTISIGENTINDRTGLYGSICNIAYYKNIMTQGQIIDNYNLLSIRNPPIF